jgi:hypothetical protein
MPWVAAIKTWFDGRFSIAPVRQAIKAMSSVTMLVQFPLTIVHISSLV